MRSLPMLLTREEVAAKLRVSVGAVRTAIRKGELSSKKLGKRVLISQAALDDYLASRTTNTPPPIHESVLADYLTEAQLSAELHRSIRTIWRWRNQKGGPPVTRVGRDVLFHKPAIMEWLKSRETTSR